MQREMNAGNSLVREREIGRHRQLSDGRQMVSRKGLQGEGDSTNGNGMQQTCLNRLRRPGRTRYA